MTKKRKKAYAPDSLEKQVYFTWIAPAFFGIVAVSAPKWSSDFAYIWGGVIFLLVLWAVIGRMRNKHRDRSWHALTNLINWDLTALFTLVPFWRIVGGSLWLLLILALLYIICVIVTHHNRYNIAKGIYTEGKTKFGRVFYTVSFIIVALSGGGTYGFTRSLQVFYGYNIALLILSVCLVPFSFILIVAFHCLWVRVEDPGWSPDD